MQLSVGMPPGPRTLELAQLAEDLGYDRVWLFDSAALYEDVWIWLGRLAEHTEIDLGTAVLVPNLRHVMTTASATASRSRRGRRPCSRPASRCRRSTARARSTGSAIRRAVAARVAGSRCTSTRGRTTRVSRSTSTEAPVAR